MKKIKKHKIFKYISISLIVIIVLSLSFAIPLHISEIIAMKECASTPGCMYCIPGKSILASMIYFICFILLILSITFFIIYKSQKKKREL